MSKYKLGQYLNLDGIKFNLGFLFNLKEIKPNLKFENFKLINLNDIPKEVRYFVFDKDNTLTLPHELVFADYNIKNKIDEFKKIYGENNLAVLSNSAGSFDDSNYKELNIIEENLCLKVIKHKYKKPNVYTEIIDHFKINSTAQNFKNEQICVIGDRLLVDITMGKKFGFYTILLDPITESKDNFIVRLVRRFENFIIKI